MVGCPEPLSFVWGLFPQGSRKAPGEWAPHGGSQDRAAPSWWPLPQFSWRGDKPQDSPARGPSTPTSEVQTPRLATYSLPTPVSSGWDELPRGHTGGKEQEGMPWGQDTGGW